MADRILPPPVRAARSPHLRRAEQARAAGRLMDAVLAYRKHLAAVPGDADASYWCAFSLWEYGDRQNAILQFKATALMAPDWPTVPNCLGSVYRELGDAEAALEAFRASLSLAPRFWAAHANIANLLWEMGRLSEAATHYRRAIEGEPDRPELYEGLAHVLAGQGSPAEALIAAREAVRLDPARVSAQSALATILSERGNHDEAEATLEPIIRRFPADAGLRSALAGVYWEAGKMDQSKAAAEEAVRRDGQMAYPWFLLAEIAAVQNQNERAAECYRKYLELDPGDTEGASLALSRLGLAPTPEKAPADYLKQIYAQRSSFWDETVEDDQPYRGPVMVAEALERVLGPRSNLDIFDAGCGTGLCGPLLRGRARRLDGVDLSAHMLEKARERKVYDELIQGDLEQSLRDRPKRYDVIASAATLIHFGDLLNPFEACAIALRPGGWMVFTAFPHEGADGVAVLSSYCHGHSRAHIANRANRAGLNVVEIREDTHEYFEGKPVTGLVVTLRRRSV